MDPELPRVAERADLFGLARRVLHLSIFHVALPRRHLPVRSELDAVRRIEIDRLDLALQPFLLREARHHQQRVAEDHPVRPVLIVVVEIHLLVERRIVEAVEIVEQRQLGLLLSGLRRVAQVLDERLRMHLLLDVDRNDGHLERARILLVLPFPHELRLERRLVPPSADPRCSTSTSRVRRPFRRYDRQAGCATAPACLGRKGLSSMRAEGSRQTGVRLRSAWASTAIAWSRVTPGNHFRKSSTLAPSSRFSKSARTGMRVPLNTQAPLTRSGARSTAGQLCQSSMAQA